MTNGIDELRNLAIARVARSAERRATAELARERGADMHELAQRLQDIGRLAPRTG